MSLSDTQKHGLDLLFEKGATTQTRTWIGAREGISGTTLEALERRGLAKTKDAKKPYPRIVGQLTHEGYWEVVRLRREHAARELVLTRGELDVIEGIVRTAEAGDKTSALDTLDRLRAIAVP